MKGDTQKIIDQIEMENAVAMMREAMGPDLFDACELMGMDAETIIRYTPLAAKFKEGRAGLNLSVKEVAAELKVPQYKIKDVEKGTPEHIDLRIFQKYCIFLKLDDYVESWAQQNSALAGKLGLNGKTYR